MFHPLVRQKETDCETQTHIIAREEWRAIDFTEGKIGPIRRAKRRVSSKGEHFTLRFTCSAMVVLLTLQVCYIISVVSRLKPCYVSRSRIEQWAPECAASGLNSTNCEGEQE